MAVQHEESDATRRYNPLLSFAREHVTLLATMVAALIFALRCVAVSGGDVYVASILVAETSTGDAIRALLFTVLPILLYVVSIAAAVMASGRIIKYGLRDPATLGLLLVSAVAWLARRYSSDGSLEVINYVAALAITFAMWGYRLVMMEPGRFRRVVVMVLAVTFISLVSWDFVSALGERAFWLPRERLVFQNEAPLTGYVLKASEDHLIILNDRPRIVIEKPKATLQDRDLCYPEDHKARSSKVAGDSPVCP